MNTTAYENETRELTVDEWDAASDGWMQTLWNNTAPAAKLRCEL